MEEAYIAPIARSKDDVKSTFLEFFYKHVADLDWADGLELYQSGLVGVMQEYSGLVTTHVQGDDRKKYDVRLKIHPSGKCIQWLECTCRKNRSLGYYCEHITAFMISLDREKNQILSNLDSKMPMKAPTIARKVPVSKDKFVGELEQRMEGATESILQSFVGQFHSVALLAHGPTIRVRLELKEGELTHYDLGIDSSARFLASNPEIRNASNEVKALKLSNDAVRLGTRIYQLDEERVVAERVIALEHAEESLTALRAGSTTDLVCGNSRRFEPGATEAVTGLFEFFSVKSHGKYLGREFFFVPGRGYWPLAPLSEGSNWHELPLKKLFKEDDAALFVRDNYDEFLRHGPVWLEDGLDAPSTIDQPELAEIRIIREEAGWFYLDPRYGKGDNAVSMLDLIRQFRKKKRKYLKAGDSWIKVPEFLKDQLWTTNEEGGLLKVDALGLLRLKAQIGEFDEYVGSVTLLNKMRNAVEFVPAGKPPSLAHTKLNLREYQSEGVEWLWWLYRNGLHGLLADEMGLGKTHQAMGLASAIQLEKPKARFLVIAPTTVLDHWEDKIRDFCPNLLPVKHHGPKRARRFDRIPGEWSTLITSYGVLLRDIREICAQTWDAVILDEAHIIKNSSTASYQAACRIPAQIRVCLSGTPIENHLGELKNLFDFLVPGYLGSDEYFKQQFMTPIEGHDHGQELALQRLIHPFKLRRTKENVLSDLPAKVEDIRHTQLSEEQARLYRNVIQMKAQPLVQQLRDDASPIPYLHVFAILTMLKQICNHPALLLKDSHYKKHESSKFELLKEILSEAMGSGYKVVVYSQYVSMITIIADYLTEAKIGHVTLTGQSRNRGKIIKHFQTEPDCKVFIGSLLAGGIGIDLTAANVVVHYDRWWNASKENQATDRVHRIGQQRNVQVLKLVTRGTLEEKIDLLIRGKQALFERFMDQDEEAFKSLSREDLISLLA